MTQALTLTAILLSLLLATLSRAAEPPGAVLKNVTEHSVTSLETGPWSCGEEELPDTDLFQRVYHRLSRRAGDLCQSGYAAKVGPLSLEYLEDANFTGGIGEPIKCLITRKLTLVADFRCAGNPFLTATRWPTSTTSASGARRSR